MHRCLISSCVGAVSTDARRGWGGTDNTVVVFSAAASALLKLSGALAV